MVSVKVKNATKTYEDGETVAADNVSFKAEDGEFFTLVGPSGCGKTTILHAIAGLLELDEGKITIGDEIVTSIEEDIKMDTQDRDVAMVFQNYALYPNMTVKGNYSFPLENRDFDEEEIEKKVEETAKTLGLEKLLERKPSDLSGGQRQRVALGRAIIRNPNVFLMDEPLGNLDARLRLLMRSEIRELQKDLGITTIYVTHSQKEATSISDKILVMKENGKVAQIGTPNELFFEPQNLYVADFIGSPPMNFVDCTLIEENGEFMLEAEEFKIPLPIFEQPSWASEYVDKELVMGIRPVDVKEENSEKASEYVIETEVSLVEPLDMPDYLMHIEKGDLSMRAVIEKPEASKGDKASIELDPTKLHIFDKESEEALMNATQ